MAEADSTMHQETVVKEEEVQRLKYLEFVETAVFQSVVCFSNLYDYAKDKSGPLKPGVETVEGTLKCVVRPVYNKFQDVPIELLKFIDRKVDESVTELDRHVPPALKQVSSQALSAAQMAPELARSVAVRVQPAGIVDTASGLTKWPKSVYSKYEPAAKELYSKYEPKAEKYAASAWFKLNQIRLFSQVAQVVLPTAAFCTDKYNQTVISTAEKGYRVSSYLPLVPKEKIAKAFGNGEAGYKPLDSNVVETDVIVR